MHTLPNGAEYENILLNPMFSKAQTFLDAARKLHSTHNNVGITAIVVLLGLLIGVSFLGYLSILVLDLYWVSCGYLLASTGSFYGLS